MKNKRLAVIGLILFAGFVLGFGAFKLNIQSVMTTGAYSAVDAEHNHSHADGAHDHGDGKTSQVTLWGDRFEIFLEHPFLVAGQPAEFTTHVSDLTTGEPRMAGPVIFVLADDSGIRREHVEPAPARAGIYIPELTFPKAGQWIVTLRISADGIEHEVNLPAVTVYATQADADAAPETPTAAGFSFLKEQQWPVRMKVQAATIRILGDKEVLAVPQTALFDEDGKPALCVQVAGETVQKRYPELGQSNADYVEIVSGVQEGEHVICQAVQVVAEPEQEGVEGDHAQDDHSHDHGAGDNMDKYGVEMEIASPGVLELKTKLAGEVKLNADRVAHVVPQVTGKVREVFKSVGDTVKTGEVMAWMESTTLGQAKIDYLSTFTEISCCAVELTRAREVHENATRLLEALEASPSLESLSHTDWGAMGKVRSDLISAYAELQYARTAYEREQRLSDQKITSRAEFQKAESVLKKAEGLYYATRDRIAFEIQHDLLEAIRAQRIRELALTGAERHLYVLGLTASDVRSLQTLTTPFSDGGHDGRVCTDPNCPTCTRARAEAARESVVPAPEHSHDDHVCTDPNCTDCAEHAHEHHTGHDPTESLSPNERLAWYPLRAPFDGTVITRHLSLGEFVKDDADAFLIADLSTVWVDFRVHERDLPTIRLGQTILVHDGRSLIEGVLTYLAPVVGDETRTALARVVLPNPSGGLRPGTFVSGTVIRDPAEAALVVEKSAIQYIDDQPCVFVYDGHAFDKRYVILGKTDGQRIEITAGLQPGENVVTKNAFRIKAETEKSKTALSGHGHVH